MSRENRIHQPLVGFAAALFILTLGAITLCQADEPLSKPRAALRLQLANESDTPRPFIFPAILGDGRKVGELTLGTTSLKQAAKMFPKIGAPVKARPNSVEFNVSGRILKPATVYNPSHTMYQLYFDGNERLVLIVDGAPELQNKHKNEVLARYPRLKESNRQSSWTEMQAELQPCVTLIAVFNLPQERLDSVGYAFTCTTG